MENDLTAILIHYKYWVMIPLTAVQGPVVMMMSGILLKAGYLALIPAYVALIIGDLIGDVLWYNIGSHWGRPFIKRFGKYFSITEEGMLTVEKIFHRHKDKILVISKMTMGFGFALATLLAAGIVRIPFRRYMVLNFIGQFFWTAFLLSVGYFFAHLYSSLADNFSRMKMIALAVIVGLVLVGLGKYLRAKIIKRYTTT